ncbi:Uncharacterized protein YR821_3447 [Yersinia ruckeri]|uniref:Uncharacterized protein n=1 Tax=Yersinia ruckeri TaxID=29486 RepID=A0A0A8VHQ4_YERRU|nr:hypothetical protein yruck0001_30090 [Yersinia ruckeri ATCC 29473]QTD78363.1 Uncharacterized protein YR821_3447 [Yersinia ruckeri]CEK29277.1 hypothetical protein CSF007_17905 [Yersinia ruckeri]
MNPRTVYTGEPRHAALQHISLQGFVFKQPKLLILRKGFSNFSSLQQRKKYL